MCFCNLLNTERANGHVWLQESYISMSYKKLIANSQLFFQAFPDDGVASVVRNVLDFDSWSGDAKDTLVRVMHRHGIPIDTSPRNVNLAKK